MTINNTRNTSYRSQKKKKNSNYSGLGQNSGSRRNVTENRPNRRPERKNTEQRPSASSPYFFHSTPLPLSSSALSFCSSSSSAFSSSSSSNSSCCLQFLYFFVVFLLFYPSVNDDDPSHLAFTHLVGLAKTQANLILIYKIVPPEMFIRPLWGQSNRRYCAKNLCHLVAKYLY